MREVIEAVAKAIEVLAVLIIVGGIIYISIVSSATPFIKGRRSAEPINDSGNGSGIPCYSDWSFWWRLILSERLLLTQHCRVLRCWEC